MSIHKIQNTLWNFRFLKWFKSVNKWKMKKENFIAEMLKKRLEKNRRELLHNPQNLPIFIVNGTEIPNEKMSAIFLKNISDFEIEENKYLESHSVN